MLSDEAVCIMATLREMNINKLRHVAALNGVRQCIENCDGWRRKRTKAEILEDIEHKLEKCGALFVPGNSSEFTIVSKRKRPNSKLVLVQTDAEENTKGQNSTALSTQHMDHPISGLNSKNLGPSGQVKSIMWAAETLESVKKLRYAAQRTPWLCSPRLLDIGISCEKCPRHWAGVHVIKGSSGGPAGFCANAGCLVS